MQIRYLSSSSILLRPQGGSLIAIRQQISSNHVCMRLTLYVLNSIVDSPQRLSTAINNIKSYRTQIKHLRKKGRGIKETAKHRVNWEDSQSAFHNRIHSGVITNIKHKDPTYFLEDSKAIFERRIHSVIKKNSAVKVNVAFCG
nr:unnamed protein product [Callosobruchus analis]